MKRTLSVGIVTAPIIKVGFNGIYHDEDGNIVQGELVLDAKSAGNLYIPENAKNTFTIHDVVIGINFHWEQKEAQTFRGSLNIIANPDNADEIIAINHIDIEDYLMSVISSEMRPEANSSLLKAHAVISRSWVLAQLGTYKMAHSKSAKAPSDGLVWYDKETHTLFDVCADDHCQRYQGLTKVINEKAKEAVLSTKGQVLTYKGGLVDARYHKCCGGALERFSTCWDDVDYDYLQPLRDNNTEGLVDLSEEEEAERFILQTPDSFCNTNDQEILQQVLNSYDQATNDFYRWEVVYSASELGQIVAKKSGKDIGDIIEIKPLNRGASGRIYRLKLIGTKGILIIGKELEIRRILSKSHLYSSAFVVQNNGAFITLKGAGWGHGVGLCQIGAALMANKGYCYQEILNHYYPNTKLTAIY